MVDEVREELIALRAKLDATEHTWLRRLGEFDATDGWVADGARHMVAWLAHFCGMSRVAASERLRVARALRRRPLIDRAMADGRLSYSKVRAMTRLDPSGADDPGAVDAELVDFATTHSADDVERLVKHWRVQADDERDPSAAHRRLDAAGLRESTTYDGKGVLELVSPVEEHLELLSLIDAHAERQWQEAKAASRGGVPTGTPAEDDDRAGRPPAGTGEDPPEGVPAGTRFRAFWERRADALLDLIRRGAASLDVPDDASGADRYTLNLVTTLADLAGHGCTTPALTNGTPISVETARRIACDCSIVSHVVGDAGEPLFLGRKTPVWNRAQRRAIRRRDGYVCRFPGCTRRITDVHHIRHWTRDKGPTDVDNGCLQCRYHHRLVHEGRWEIEGDPNGTLTFVSPDGRRYESKTPRLMPARPVTAADAFAV